MKQYIYFLTLLTTLSFMGCGENTTNPIVPDVTSIQINESNISIYSTDSTSYLSANASYTDGSTQDITNFVLWSSSNTDAATVSNNALTGGNGNGGDTQITIKYDRFSDTQPVHVHKLTSYSVLYPDVNTTGTYDGFRALGNFDNNETNRSIATHITWSADNGAVIEVKDDGNVSITFLSGDTNVTTTLFNETNTSSPIGPKSKIFTIN